MEAQHERTETNGRVHPLTGARVEWDRVRTAAASTSGWRRTRRGEWRGALPVVAVNATGHGYVAAAGE